MNAPVIDARDRSVAIRRLRMTTAQALVRHLAALRVDGSTERLFGGVFAIFGHGNVASLGEALHACRDQLPTYRAHNEQAMALAAIAYAKAHQRRRMMACTTSIGPGATNLVTAAATAHVNRLPVLLLPGDVFMSRAPDPVLQQLERPDDGTASVNDSLRAVSRHFDRIVHPAQLLTALPRAVHHLTDAAQCGPVTLALPQDVQAMAYDYPETFFEPAPVRFHAPAPIEREIERAALAIEAARRPLLIVGGGVLYSEGGPEALRRFVERYDLPVGETHAGKSALAWDHPCNAGAIGCDGGEAANALAREVDLVVAIGTRLGDFASGSNALFPQADVIGINASPLDGLKHEALAVTADAAAALDALAARLAGWRTPQAWSQRARAAAGAWRGTVLKVTGTPPASGRLPYEAHVIGAVQLDHADSPASDICVGAAGTLPAELHKLWRAAAPGGYHVEYGYSCMGYEIAGGLGVKLARPEREVFVFVGDGSYLMMNSEIATSVMLGLKLIVLVLDNRGFGCIDRLQRSCGSEPFNNLLEDCLQGPDGAPAIDFAAHARALGAQATHVANLTDLRGAIAAARSAQRTSVIVIDTDPDQTSPGGAWWEVAVPEVSERVAVREARAAYETAIGRRNRGKADR